MTQKNGSSSRNKQVRLTKTKKERVFCTEKEIINIAKRQFTVCNTLFPSHIYDKMLSRTHKVVT